MGMRCIFANGGRAEPIRPRNRKRLRPYMASQALVFSILQNRNSMAAHPCEAGKANCKTEAVLQCRKILHLRVRRNQLFRQRFAGVGPHGHFHSQRGARPGSGLKLRRLPCHIRSLEGCKSSRKPSRSRVSPRRRRSAPARLQTGFPAALSHRVWAAPA